MIKSHSLAELFPEIQQRGQLPDHFIHSKITSVNVYKKSRKIHVSICPDSFVLPEHIHAAQSELSNLFDLCDARICVSYDKKIDLEHAVDQYRPSLEYLCTSKAAFSKGILLDSEWEVEGRKLKIKLKNPGAEFLRSRSCDVSIEEALKEWFDIVAKVEFQELVRDDEQHVEYLKQKGEDEARIIEIIKLNEEVEGKRLSDKPAEKNMQKSGEKAYEKPKYTKNFRSPKIVPDASIKGDPILGKLFGDKLVSIDQVTMDSGRVAMEGRIFCFESKDIKNGKKIVMFDITNYKSSLTCKFFCKYDDYDFLSARLKEGLWVRVRGDAQYDKFSNELAVMVSDIVEVSKPEKMDAAEKRRVELHLHTQMSQMDGMTSVTDLIKRAAKWGHSAIAITDHGVVQAFPDAYSAGKKNKIKILYGMECYLVDDSVPVVYHAREYPLDGEYVVFDIETTGLSPENDRITEIGAVKLLGGKVVDKFSSFVNPGIPIPREITELTHITDEMVAGAPKIEEVLTGFLKFIGACPVVAHNAQFDMGFIRANARRMGIEFELTVLDTLQLCRLMFPGLSKYKLDSIAAHLKFKIENYHRAVDDSAACARIFVHCCEVLKEKGVSSITEIQDALEGVRDIKKMPSYHAIILVKNMSGLKNLYKLVSKSHLEYFYKKPRIPKSLLLAYRDGLILGSACEAGELFSAILDGREEADITRIVRFYDYLEIQPLGNNKFLLENGKVKDEDGLKAINKRIVSLGERHKKPVVATCDVHFLDPLDEVYRRVLMASQGFKDADNQAPLFFRTTEEMLEEFSYLGEKKSYEVVVENTNMIAKMTDEIIPIPEETFPPKIEGAEDEIRRLAEGKVKEIYGDPIPEVVFQRLEKELNSIIKNGFSVMYIIAQKLVWKSLSDGYLVGSRGSVGSSFVATMAGITEVNPLPPHYVCPNCKMSEFVTDGSVACGVDMEEKTCLNCGTQYQKNGYDIPFETFLGFDGDKEPDIDLNFSGVYQSVAHKYTEELFGEGHVFRAGTIGTIADKTAFGYVKNYADERALPIANAEIKRLVKGCTGVKRTTGQHPGGVMIVPQDNEIYNFCPIQRPADDTTSSIITTHFDYHSISGRLLKLDILGHDDPTAIRMLEDLTGVDATKIPIGEKRTMGIFSSTEPLGLKPEDINSPVATFAIPEFGTKFVRQMLLDTKPTTFSELIRISGLSHGTDVWLNNAQELVRAGTATLPEVICTRDDIMVYLMHKGLVPKTAFKIMEDVRKGKGLKDEYVEAMKEKDVPEWYIESCRKIKYMFPKAHAAAYVMMAFRIAWFKVYYPEAFYVTYFTVRADDFDAQLMTHGQDRVKRNIRELEAKGNNMSQKEKNVLTILEVANEMYARGINFLPIDLYKSDSDKFLITPDGIRPPFSSLQGLGGSAAKSIIEARKDADFLSVDDLRIRGKASKTVIDILRENRCLEGMPESNQISFF